jgi:hypothetical protein
MQEEEQNKWELDSLTTRQGRYRAPVRANFSPKHAFGRLLTFTHWRHRKSPPVAIFRPVKPVVTCRESQFSNFGPLTGPMARKNGELPTYTQQVNKVVVFTLNQQSHAGIVTT